MKELVMIILPLNLKDIKHILDKNALHHCALNARL